jgi:hypothetical protein
VTVDFSDRTIDLPLYTVRVTAQAAADAVTLACEVTHKFDPAGDLRGFATCFVLADGMGGADKFPLASGWGGPYPPHLYARVTAGRVTTETYTLVRAGETFLVPAGPVELHLKVFDEGSRAIAFVKLSVDLPPRPVPTLKSGKIVRSLFWGGPDSVEQDNAAAAFRAAGVTALETGAFSNPADSGGDIATITLQQAKDYWTQNAGRGIQKVRDLGFLAVLIGDDLFRSPTERNFIRVGPVAHDYVVWVAQQWLANADIIAGIQLLDEAPDISTDPVYQTVVDWVRGVWPTAPLSWPNQNWDGLVLANEVPGRASYATRYLALDGALENNAATIGEVGFRYGKALANLPAGWPVSSDMGATGPFYRKGAPGPDYNPSTDTLIKPGADPAAIVAQPWIALALAPLCGIRTYTYDAPFARNGRAGSGVGSDNQTGVKPGDDRWSAFSVAYNSIGTREAELLSGFQPPQRQGPWLLGFRDGLEWAVNLSSLAAECPPGQWRLVTPAGEVAFPGGTVPSGGVVIRA